MFTRRLRVRRTLDFEARERALKLGATKNVDDRIEAIKRPTSHPLPAVATDELAPLRGRNPSTARSNGRPDRFEVVRQIRSTTVVPGQLLTSRPSLHSALKEFFDPLRTDDSRADFFAVYHKESGEFDRDYAKKYDEDLNTSLIFVSHLISILVTKR